MQTEENSMKPDLDYYSLLNVGMEASTTEISEAYVVAIERSRSGLGKLIGFFTNSTPERIRTAYLTLSDPTLRAEYDAHLNDLCMWHFFRAFP